jgi:hypothetical protein
MIEFRDFLQALTDGKASALAVAIEVPRVLIVDAWLEQNYAGFRDQHTVSAQKTFSIK